MKEWQDQFRVPTATLLAIILFGLTASAAAQHTYYISKSLGSDSNTATQAQSKTTPWAHLPGMPSCSSKCASYTPVAGDSFILYGGDTWGVSDLGVNWQWSGNSASTIYVGVDQTWYGSSCGSSFCRPVFNCAGAACSANNNDYFNVNASYVTFDNIEMTGLYKNDSNFGPDCYFFVNGTYIEVEHMYFHGWTLGTSGSNGGFAAWYGYSGGSPLTGTQLHDNVFDGNDTAKNSLYGVWGGVEQLYNNYFRYLVADIVGLVNIMHDNTGEYMVLSASGDHCNLFFAEGTLSGTTLLAYNNLARNTNNSQSWGCGGGVHFYLFGYTTSNQNYAAYYFNNIGVNLYPANLIDPGSSMGSGPWGTYYVFNNTFECGNDSSTAACIAGPGSQTMTLQVHSQNNHYITSTSPACVSQYGQTCTETTDLTESVSTAKGYGYTSSETYAFSPTSSSSPTVGQGTNQSSLCSTIAVANSAAGTACQSDTTYGVGYNTSNHTVITPQRTTNTRPSTGAWDIGAYEETASGSSPNPPTGLTAIVQ